MFGTVVGNVGRDADLRTTPSGSSVLNFSVADNVYHKGEKKVQWFRVAIFGKRAEALAEHIKKGSTVAVSGEVFMEVYNDKSYLEMNAVNVNIIKSPGSSGEFAREVVNQAAGGFSDDIPF